MNVIHKLDIPDFLIEREKKGGEEEKRLEILSITRVASKVLGTLRTTSPLKCMPISRLGSLLGISKADS